MSLRARVLVRHVCRRLPVLLIAVAATRCAHMEPPSGGPVDTKPPAVAAVFPAPGARNVALDAPIVFQFSEWILRDGVRNKVFVSPPAPGRLQVVVNGNKMQVSPGKAAGGWRPGTPYQVTLLPTVVDLHAVQAGKPFILRFSTGPDMDSASVSGNIQAEARQGTLMAALYRVTGRAQAEAISLRDTGFHPASLPEPWRELPAFLAAADSLGNFHFDSVSQGDYALLAFDDVNANFTFDLGFESAAVGPLSVGLRPHAPDQVLRLAPVDTNPLRILKTSFIPDSPVDSAPSAFVTGNVKIEFSRAPHPGRAAEAARYRLLPDSGAALAVLSAGWNAIQDAWILETPPLRAGRDYRVEMRSRPDFPARNGAASADTSVSFTAEAALTTSAARDSTDWVVSFMQVSALTGLPRAFSAALPGRDFSVLSSRPLTPARWDVLQQRLQARVDSAPAPTTISRVNNFTFSLRLLKALPAGKKLELGLRPVPDDTVSRLLGSIQALDSSAFGSLRFTPPARWASWIFRLENLDGSGSFRLPSVGGAPVEASVPSGRYGLFAFRDDDRDSVWNPGALKPWTPQESYVTALDSVTVKPREQLDVTGRFRK